MPNIVQGTTVENLLTGRRFLVEWSPNQPSEGVSSYQIWRAENSLSGFELTATVSAPTTQYVDKVPFTFGIAFFYKVIAVDAAGLSSDITITTPVSDVTFDSFEEFPFRPTNVTFDSFVKNEASVGTQDSANTTFSTAALYRLGTLEVVINGVVKTRDVDYTENNDQQNFTITVAPASSDVIRLNYVKL